MRVLVLCALAAVCACGADDRSPETGPGSAQGGGDAGLSLGPDASFVHTDGGGSTLDAGISVLDAAMPSCVKGQYTAKARPLDMFILLDQSGSMQEDEDRWTPVTKAIKAFVGSPGLGRTGVALQYFPLGTDDSFKCESESYVTPDVGMADLPGNAQPIVDSIDAHYFSHEECCDTPEHAGTPTRPAMEGAVAYMRAWIQSNPEHVGVILLATDGEPSSVCDDNTASRVAEVVEGAAQGSPQIRTYVIGIGDDEYLDEMAAPGGTGRGPFLVDGSGARTEQDLLTALSGIRSEALPCDFAVERVAEPTRLNVEVLSGTNMGGSTLVNVADEGQCDKAQETGWFYDDPRAPRRIYLCPATCAALSRDPSGSVRIVEGCETVVLL